MKKERGFLFSNIIRVALILVASLLLVVSCARQSPTSTPKATSTSAPSQTTASTAKPAPTSVPPEKMTREQWQAWYAQEMAKLETSAVAQRKIMLYSGSENETLMKAVTKYFEDKYRIQAEWLPLQAPALVTRIKAEAAAGKVLGDWHYSGSPVNRQMASEGYYEDYTPPAALEPGVNWAIDPMLDRKDPAFAGKAFPITVFPTTAGAMINTKLVPPDKEPKTYKDLLDPFWKGKIGLNDPRVSGGGNVTYMWMYANYGEGFLQQFKAQGVKLERSYALGASAVAAGEYLIYLGTYSQYLPGAGAPVKFMYPEGVISGLGMAGVLKNSPNPAGAKLFMNFVLSKEGQEMFARLGDKAPLRGDVKGVTDFMDFAYLRNAGVKILPPPTFEDDMKTKAAMQEHAKGVFGQ